MNRRRQQRAGSVLILTALMMIVLMAVLAFTVDVGYMIVVRSELQRTADAAALAGAWELVAEEERIGDGNLVEAKLAASTVATNFASINHVTNIAPALGSQDLTVGYRTDIFDQTEPIDTTASDANIVQVRVRKASDVNGRVPFIFARAFGFVGAEMEAEATAALLTNFRGFRPPSNGDNLDILPFALDEGTWFDMLNDQASDDWKWDAETGQIASQSDGVREVNLYPQGTGSPGNRGTVDIGSPNNSTSDISRQILDGISANDLSYMGGSLEFDSNDEMFLNADTGISAGFKDELKSMKGKPRIIPLFSQISGNGNNAMYTITHFCGVRIMDVKLTGKMSEKRVIVQPCAIKTQGGIPGTPGENQTYFVVSPVSLIH